MSKKDYELIARALKDSKPQSKLNANYQDNVYFERMVVWESVINKVAAEMENENPRFNRAKFLQACGYND
jgi:hypothetical protein